MSLLRPNKQQVEKYSMGQRLANYCITQGCEVGGAVITMAGLGETVKDADIREAKSILSKMQAIQKNERMYRQGWVD